MMDRLGQFFDQDRSREDDYRDFERRYRENPDQISEREAAQRYREMMANMQDDDDDDEAYQEYERSFGQMSPQERRMLAERYQQATRDSGRPYQGYRDDYDLDRASSPHELARMTRRAAQEDPDLLDQLVGQNSPLSGTAGKVALAGLAAFAAQRFLGGRR
jgi:hypothetical protein